MPFLPTTINLNTLDEFKNLLHKIQYYEEFGIAPALTQTYYPVTITAVIDNSTIKINGDTISGYYSDAFNNDIHYRNKDDTFTTVNKFEQINTNNIYGIHHYDADENRTRVYSYIATASTGATQTYTVTVTNNWSNGRNQLLKYNNNDYYQTYVKVTFINNKNESVIWVNSFNGNVDWENKTWPNL